MCIKKRQKRIHLRLFYFFAGSENNECLHVHKQAFIKFDENLSPLRLVFFLLGSENNEFLHVCKQAVIDLIIFMNC